ANGDNTDKLPVDMHEAMALIAPRAIYIVDNPGITNLDPKSAYVTGMAGKAIFTALGVGDNFAYQGAGGNHCDWRSAYSATLTAMIDRFLRGKDTTMTGNFATDLGSKPTATQYYTWDTTELPGTL
ncbi:MAG TPA: PE PGRS family protein, partial [Polyangiaceae bacterium]|nr:PE PGRS family protein [Polyangiaceae bacterium]